MEENNELVNMVVKEEEVVGQEAVWGYYCWEGISWDGGSRW